MAGQNITSGLSMILLILHLNNGIFILIYNFQKSINLCQFKQKSLARVCLNKVRPTRYFLDFQSRNQTRFS